MPASYPGSVKSFTTKVDGVDDVQAAHVNDLQLEVAAVETELGLNPSGASATVADRIGNIETEFTTTLDINLLKLGTGVSKSTYPQILLAKTLINTSHGFMDAVIFNGNAGESYAAFDAFFESGGANNLNHLIGFQSRVEHKGSGTLSKLYGFGSFPNNVGGTITDLYGLYAADPTGGSPITTNYGIYVSDMTAGGTNYAIYTNAGVISLGASVTIRNGGLSTINGAIVLAFTGNPIAATRNVALATGAITLEMLLAKTSVNMTDGFGPAISFNVQDDTSASIALAIIGASRAGADNTGDFIISTTNAGSNAEKLRVTAAGDVKVIVGRLYPVQKTTAAAPTYEKGAIYFDTTLNKLRVGGATAWETVTSA